MAEGKAAVAGGMIGGSSGGGSPRSIASSLRVSRSIARTAPLAVFVRAKLYRIKSGKEEWLDYERIFRILRGVKYNGFVCLVDRPWDNNFDNPDFWNPKFRAPECFNAPAARSFLPAYLKRTEWVLAGVSRADMQARTKSAVAAHQIGAPEVGSMVYMMSKDTYLADGVGHWYPHLMFLLPRTSAQEWGADLKGSPVYSDSTFLEPLTIFFVPVTRWSDGTLAEVSSHTAKAGASAAKR